MPRISRSPRTVWDELHAAGRITEHPVFPGKRGPAARRIETEADVADVVALMRLNYDRIAARVGPGCPFRTRRGRRGRAMMGRCPVT